MTDWNHDDLRTLAAAREVHIAGIRRDGSARSPVIIWAVVVEGSVFVRSALGASAAWYRGVLGHGEAVLQWRGGSIRVTAVPDASHDDAVDRAYLAKYRRAWEGTDASGSPTRETTLRLDPI